MTIWTTDTGQAAAPWLAFSSGGIPSPGLLTRIDDTNRASGRPAGARQPWPGPDQPDRRTARILAEVRRTPAGLFFVPLPVLAGSLPAAPDAYLVLYVPLVDAGFEVAGHVYPPPILARAIRCLPNWRRRPVVVVPISPPSAAWSSPPPSSGHDGPRSVAQIMAELAAGLGVDVICSYSGIYTGRQVLITSSSFLRWPAVVQASASDLPPEPLGGVLPVRTGRA